MKRIYIFRKKNPAVIVIITVIFWLAVLSAVMLLLLWQEECLTAECGGRFIFVCPIQTGESFEITFTHSLNLSPITDVIEWTGSDLIVRKSIFRTFGAGVPVLSDGIGTELIHVDGHYELIGIDKHTQSITVMTQDVPDHRVVFDGREFFLLELAGSGKQVNITVKRFPVIINRIRNIFN